MYPRFKHAITIDDKQLDELPPYLDARERAADQTSAHA
jgi:hypothetical protein